MEKKKNLSFLLLFWGFFFLLEYNSKIWHNITLFKGQTVQFLGDSLSDVLALTISKYYKRHEMK